MKKLNKPEQQQATGVEAAADSKYYIRELFIEADKTTFVLNTPKNGCNRIILQPEKERRIERMLLDCFDEGKDFDFRIAKNLGNGACSIECVHRSYNRSQLGKDATRGYNTLQIIVEAHETVFVLNMPKNGYNQIVFQFEERGDLKRLLMGLFEAGKPYDFEVAQHLDPGRCKINKVIRTYG